MQLVREARAASTTWTCQLIHPGDLAAEEAIRWATLLDAKGHNEFAKRDEQLTGIKGGLRRLSVATHMSREPGPSEPPAYQATGRRDSVSGRRESITGRRQSISGRRSSLAHGGGSRLGGIQERVAGDSGLALADSLGTANCHSLCKYKVLAKCSVREGRHGDSTKLGEYAKGMVIDVVDESRSDTGLAVVRSVTVLQNGSLGGWVKVRTAKGRIQVEKQLGVKSDRRMSITQKNTAGQVVTPSEQVVDVVFEGSGALGLMFHKVVCAGRSDVLVKSLVPGSIAAESKDLVPGMILRAVNGVDITQKEYTIMMQMIGNIWRLQQKVMLTFLTPEILSDSEEGLPEDGTACDNGWVDGSKFGNVSLDKNGALSPRYKGAVVWGENVVEKPLSTMMYLGFPEPEAKQALAGHNDVDMAIAQLARVTPAQV